MAHFSAGIVDIIKNDAGLGAVINDRIHGSVIPQPETYPAVTYQGITNRQSNTKDGPSTVVRYLVQFVIYAKTYQQMADIELLLEAALNWNTLTGGPSTAKYTAAGVTFLHISPEDQGDDDYDHRTNTHFKRVDYLFAVDKS
jgi:hypothetical protein